MSDTDRNSTGTQTAPSRETAQSGPNVEPSPVPPCARCGETAPPNEKGQCPNPKCRTFRKGHPGPNLKTGVYSAIRIPQTEARCRAIRDGLLHRYGIGVPDPQLSAAIDDFAFVKVQMDLISEHLNQLGIFTERGRRKAALDAYLALSQRAEKLTAQIRDLAPPPPPDTSEDDAEAFRWLTFEELRDAAALIAPFLALARSRRAAGEDTRDTLPNLTVPSLESISAPASTQTPAAPDAKREPARPEPSRESPDDAAFRQRNEEFTRQLFERGTYGFGD